jgi:hypothetical protein
MPSSFITSAGLSEARTNRGTCLAQDHGANGPRTPTEWYSHRLSIDRPCGISAPQVIVVRDPGALRASLLIGIARPLPALAGFALVLAGLPVYEILAKRGTVSRRPGGFR